MSRKKRSLLIRITYEPNRLAKGYLTSAYETLVPTVKSVLKAQAIDSHPMSEMPLKQVGVKSR